MRLDHVIYGTRDLGGAAAMLEEAHGLGFLSEERRPGGTNTCVAPLAPPQYLELMAVEKAEDTIARTVQTAIEGGRTLLSWAIRVDDIEAVAVLRDRELMTRSNTNADGSSVSYRLVASADPSLPFFISYDNNDERMGLWQERVRRANNADFGGFTFVEVGGDPIQMREWLGDADLPVRFVSGDPGLHAVGIAGPRGEIVLRDTP